MSNKFFVGCGVVLGLLVAAVLVFTWITIVRPTRTVLADIEIVAGLDSLDAGLENQTPFSPPPDGILTPLQVERFARVQEFLCCRLHGDYAELDGRARRFRGLAHEDEGKGGFREALAAFDGLGPILRHAKRLQIRALNDEGFSREEYRWVRTETYRSLGLSGGEIYLEDIARRFRDGETITRPPRDERPVPARNRDVAAPYGVDADCWVPFFVFGL